MINGFLIDLTTEENLGLVAYAKALPKPNEVEYITLDADQNPLDIGYVRAVGWPEIRESIPMTNTVKALIVDDLERILGINK